MAFDPDKYLSNDTGFDPDAYLGSKKEELKQPSVFEQSPIDALTNFAIKDIIVPTGEFIDKYTGAPTRAAVSALQEGKPALEAFGKQFGANPELAPTGKEIAARAGASTTPLSEFIPGLYSKTGEGLPLQKGGLFDPSLAGVLGLGINIGADPTNLIGIGPMAKGAGALGKLAIVEGGGGAIKAGAKAADILTGTKAASKTIETAGDIGKGAAGLISKIVNPKQAEEFATRVKIAQENDIPIDALSSSLEFGPSSIITRTEKAIAEGPAGQKLLEKHNEGLKQIEDAVERRFQKIAGGKEVSTPVETGQKIRDYYNEGVDQIFNNADMTYNSVLKYAPGLRVDAKTYENLASKLDGVEKYAKGLVKRGTDAEISQGKHLLRTVDAIRNSGNNFKQLNEQRQWIGKYAFSDKVPLGTVPPDVAKLRDIYGEISNALEQTTRAHVNPEFADEILKNNEVLSDFYKKRKQIIGDVAEGATADENLLKRVFSDSNKAQSLELAVGPERFNEIKASYLKSLIKQTASGDINFSQLSRELKNKSGFLSKIASPEEIKSLQDLAQLGSDYGGAILSTSGTGASMGFKDLLDGLARGVVSEKTVNKLKEMARKNGINPATVTRKNLESGQISLDMFPELRRFLGYRPSAVGQRSKIMQSLSPTLQSDEERNKARLRALEGY